MTRGAVLQTFRMRALPCLLLLLSPGASWCHPKGDRDLAATRHEPRQWETLAAAGGCRAVAGLGQGWGGWEAACGPRGAGLPRRDLSSQLLGLLKIISSLLANELAAGRAPPASPHPAALPLPPWSGGSFSLWSSRPLPRAEGRGEAGAAHAARATEGFWLWQTGPKGAAPANSTNAPEGGTPTAESSDSGLRPQC